jgi:hypothetical protein
MRDCLKLAKARRLLKEYNVTVYGVMTSHVPRGGEMVLLLLMSTFYPYHDHRYVM